MEVEWRRCQGSGCGERWPFPEASPAALCPKCSAVRERIRCLHVVESRELKLRHRMAYTPAPPDQLARWQAELAVLVELCSELRRLPVE